MAGSVIIIVSCVTTSINCFFRHERQLREENNFSEKILALSGSAGYNSGNVCFCVKSVWVVEGDLGSAGL